MREWVDKAVDAIVALYDPDEIVLFGSYAENRQTLQSDIDLLIVKDTNLPRRHRGLELIRHLKRYPVKFDLLFYTHSEVERAVMTEHSFIASILDTGTVLFRKT